MKKRVSPIACLSLLAAVVAAVADQNVDAIASDNTTSTRVVITFSNATLRESAPDLPADVVVVKEYGRRLVLDLTNATSDSEWVKEYLGADTVESDLHLTADTTIEAAAESDLRGALDSVIGTIISDYAADMNTTNVSAALAFAYFLNQNGQWALGPDEPYSIHPQSIWDYTNGSNMSLVAVLDSGLPSVALPLFANIHEGSLLLTDTHIHRVHSLLHREYYLQTHTYIHRVHSLLLTDTPPRCRHIHRVHT